MNIPITIIIIIVTITNGKTVSSGKHVEAHGNLLFFLLFVLSVQSYIFHGLPSTMKKDARGIHRNLICYEISESRV
jgi:hypothetical protein